MTTTDTKPSANPQQLIEQRLDALDRALLGILPRSERLALVSQVETRVRELTDSNSATSASLEIAVEPEVIAGAVSRGATGSSKRRSRLALSSGILGITALVMLFAMPITYLFVVTIGEDLGEIVAYSLLGIHVLTVAVGGLVALVMGIAGLVSLARRKGQLVGHGWAITGLCTAPLPTLVGGLMVLVTSLSLLAASGISVESSGTPVNVVSTSSTYYPASAISNGPSPAANCAPASAAPSCLPLPLSAAPIFCAPGNDSPQSRTRDLVPTGYAVPNEPPVDDARPRDYQSQLQPAPTTPASVSPQVAPVPSIAQPALSFPAPSSAAPPSLR